MYDREQDVVVNDNIPPELPQGTRSFSGENVAATLCQRLSVHRLYGQNRSVLFLYGPDEEVSAVNSFFCFSNIFSGPIRMHHDAGT